MRRPLVGFVSAMAFLAVVAGLAHRDAPRRAVVGTWVAAEGSGPRAVLYLESSGTFRLDLSCDDGPDRTYRGAWTLGDGEVRLVPLHGGLLRVPDPDPPWRAEPVGRDGLRLSTPERTLALRRGPR
jgi:hypothetical protein